MKLGLFGGTFNPVHTGHLRCAQEVLETLGLDRIIFIPASCPPLKTSGHIAPFHHRKRMVELAIEGNDSFLVSDIENHRKGKSYSIDTVKYFIDHFSEKLELYFILGQDAFHEMRYWKDWEELLLLCNFVVIARPGYETKQLAGVLPSNFASQFRYIEDRDSLEGPTGYFIYLKRLTLLDISSTDIRDRVKKGDSIMYLVPEPVRRYIIEHSLYVND